MKSVQKSFRFRHFQQWLPFQLGQDYGQECYQVGEHRFDWWWYDRDYWKERFARLAEAGFNGITFWNVHPYPLLIRYHSFPEAAFFSPAETDRNIAHFNWLISEGKRCGIDIVLMEYIIHCSPGFGRKHGLPFAAGRGWGCTDTPLLREYNRYCHEELFRTYPDLSGLMTCWEAAKDNTDFFEKSILAALNRMAAPPRLFLRLWGAHFPQDIRRLAGLYRGDTVLTHKITQENIFKPVVDSRIPRWKKETGLPIMALFGPGNATGKNVKGLLWGDPEFTARLFNDLRKKGGDGIGCFAGFDNWIGRGRPLPKEPLTDAMKKYREVMWLHEEAAGFYAACPDARFEESFWIRRINQHFKTDRGRSIFKSIISSSRIVPRYICLVDRDYGIPFGGGGNLGVIGPFTVSSNADHKGDFRLHGPYAYPFHRWGETVVSVMEFARNPGCHGTSPLAVARELESLAGASLRYMGRVKKSAGMSPSLENLRDYVEWNAIFGRYASEKIKAGVELYSAGFESDGRAASVRLRTGIRHLEKTSLLAKRSVALGKSIPLMEQMGQFYPKEIRQSIPLLEREIAGWKRLVRHIGHTTVPYSAIAEYWRSWDCYNQLCFYVRKDHHLSERTIRKAVKLLRQSIRHAGNTIEKLDGFPGEMKRSKAFLSFLEGECRRMEEIPLASCSATSGRWIPMAFNGGFYPPLNLEYQLLSLFETKVLSRKNPAASFSVFRDRTHIHVLLKDAEKTGLAEIYFDPGRTGKKYSHFAVNLNSGTTEGYLAELVPDRGLRYSPWNSGAIIATHGDALHFSFPFCRLGHRPEKGDLWGFNIFVAACAGSFCSMLDARGAPARFGILSFQ